MTATSPSSVTESASSTDDPDAQARRANDGELSALQSDVTIDQVAADGGLTAAEFPNERFDKSVDSTQLYAEYRRLLAEQAALRRVATLVARGVRSLEVLGTVAEEIRTEPLIFRHEARFGLPDGEISGHFHPIAALTVRGRGIRRRCFLTDGRRVILPGSEFFQ